MSVKFSIVGSTAFVCGVFLSTTFAANTSPRAHFKFSPQEGSQTNTMGHATSWGQIASKYQVTGQPLESAQTYHTTHGKGPKFFAVKDNAVYYYWSGHECMYGAKRVAGKWCRYNTGQLLLTQFGSAYPATLADNYFSIGVAAGFLSLPVHTLAYSGSTYHPSLTYQPKNVLVLPSIKIGHYFTNHSFLRSLFGDRNSIELSVQTGLYKYQQTKTPNADDNTIWNSNGAGESPVIPTGYVLNSVKGETKQTYIGSGIYWRGNKMFKNTWVEMQPSIGAIFNYIKEDNTYHYNYTVSSTPVQTVNRDEKTNTYYYGLSIGDQFNYLATKQFTPFLGLELQVLYAKTTLEVHDNSQYLTGGQPDWNLSVRTSATKYTYRGILDLGMKLKLTHAVNSPAVILDGGLDYWGYRPKIIEASKGVGVHLANATAAIPFVGITLQIPFV